MMLGIRVHGESRIRFVVWRGQGSPGAGSDLILPDGGHAKVIIAGDQFHGMSPPGEKTLGPGTVVAPLLTDSLTSIEAERYDAVLAAFPQLGDRLETAAGVGQVVARSVRDGTVTLRLAASPELITIPLADLSEE